MKAKNPRSALDDNPETARYYCFTRTWWRENERWPNGLEPHAGPARVMARNLSMSEAQDYCRSWNAKHPPGRLSLKCEFDQQ